MSDGSWSPVLPLPPYGPAPGPVADDGAVLAAFAQGRPAGHSARWHVEGPALIVNGDVAAGLRLSADVVMVRVDLPEEVADVRPLVEAALEAEALTCLDEATKLGLPVALQVLGLRLSTWNVWGRDLDDVFEVLRQTAIGEQELPPTAHYGEEYWAPDNDR